MAEPHDRFYTTSRDVTAAEYKIQVQGAIMPPGGASAVHLHSGSESWYVVSGEQTVYAASDVIRLPAGQGFAGFPGGTPIQLVNEGPDDRHAFRMFVVDAAEPQTSPADFELAQPAD